MMTNTQDLTTSPSTSTSHDALAAHCDKQLRLLNAQTQEHKDAIQALLQTELVETLKVEGVQADFNAGAWTYIGEVFAQASAHARQLARFEEELEAVRATREQGTIGWQFLDSSLIDEMHYDAASWTLTLRLENGSLYQYGSVPSGVALQLLNAGSPGRYYNAEINGTYPSLRLDA